MDVGLEALRLLHEGLMMEEEWISMNGRAFSWKADSLVQEICASQVFESRGHDVSLITARTLLVDHVTLDLGETRKILCDLNSFAVGSALLLDEDKMQVWSLLGHQVHAGSIEFRVSQLYLLGLLQLTHAERSAPALAAMLSGRVPVDSMFAERTEPGEILSLPGELISPHSSAPSRFTDQTELQSVFAMILDDESCASDGWWEQGISIELPFGPSDTSLIELRNDVAHPSLGAGLAVRTTFRTDFIGADALLLATQLQRLQMETVAGGGQMGAWGIRSDLPFANVAWFRFVPNALFQRGLTPDIAMGEINRAMWCDSVVFPGLPLRKAREQMIARDKLRTAVAASPLS